MGNAELQARQKMDQGVPETGRALNMRPAMTEPIDESRDAPEGQQTVKNHIDE